MAVMIILYSIENRFTINFMLIQFICYLSIFVDNINYYRTQDLFVGIYFHDVVDFELRSHVA